MISPAGFNSMLRRIGHEVLVLTKTPTYDDDGKLIRTPSRDVDGNIIADGGEIVYDEEGVVLLARIAMDKGSDKSVEGAFIESGDAIGMFKKSDMDYLAKDNFVSLNYESGNDYYFQMLKPVERITFIEVILKRTER